MADQVLQDIKDRLNIADVISGYIQIKKAGVNFKALCPFHHEKTPSLQISPQKQIWHCFGCGEGGDVFGFVMKYESVDFREALKILAQKAGVQLPEYRPADPQQQSEKDLLYRINDFAARFYHKILVEEKQGKDALGYLEKRGLSKKIIERWQIGFAPDEFHALEQALAKKKVNASDLVKAGVSAKNERGQVYDRFRGRVTFPIFDYNGSVVGFSARILQDDGKSAKYVNSPETVIYSKGRVLFGLNFAKNAIRKLDEAVIVEGQMDCIAPHQAGFENVVATSGTALTVEQLAMLGRLTKNLKFCFDGDAAGQAAARRAGELALKQGFRLKVIALDKVKDPDELIKKSPGLWEKAVAEAVWFLDWQMAYAEKTYAKDPVEQKHYLSQAVVPLLGAIADPLEQDHYVRRMAERFGIFERTIREQIKRQSAGLSRTASKPIEEGAGIKSGLMEKEILGGLLVYPEFFQTAQRKSRPEEFEEAEVRRLADLLWHGRQDQVLAEPVAKEAVFMVESQRDALEGGDGQELRQLEKMFALFKVNAIKRQQQRLNADIRRAETLGDKPELQKLTKAFADLSVQRLEFEKLM